MSKKLKGAAAASSPDWFYPLLWKSVEAHYSISADARAAAAKREKGSPSAATRRRAPRRPKTAGAV